MARCSLPPYVQRLPPDRKNVLGARWNPPQTPAIYTSLERETALAEAEYTINMQPVRPRVERTLYRVSLQLNSTLDLSNWMILEKFDLSIDDFSVADFQKYQYIGAAVDRLGYDGLFVPSARANGINLVIFPNQKQMEEYQFEVISQEDVSDYS